MQGTVDVTQESWTNTIIMIIVLFIVCCCSSICSSVLSSLGYSMYGSSSTSETKPKTTA